MAYTLCISKFGAYDEQSQPDHLREVVLFRNNRSQAVRIPREFELPGERTLIRREHGRLIVEPVDQPGLIALLDGWERIAEELPGIDDPPPPEPVDLGQGDAAR